MSLTVFGVHVIRLYVYVTERKLPYLVRLVSNMCRPEARHWNQFGDSVPRPFSVVVKVVKTQQRKTGWVCETNTNLPRVGVGA